MLQLGHQRVFGADDDAAAGKHVLQGYSCVLSDTWHSGGSDGRVSSTLASAELSDKLPRNFRLNGH